MYVLISSEEIAFCSDAESSPHTCSHLCSADAVGVFSDMKSCSILHSVQCLLILRFNIAVSSSVQLKPGEDLILVLPIPGPVEVIYNTSDSSGPCCELICTVVGGSLHCEDEYSLRVSLRYPNLTLEAVNVSDNGVYIVRDRKHNEDLHVYNVSVEDTNIKQTSAPPEELIVGLVVLLVGAAGLISVYLTRTTVLVNNTCAIEKEEHAERERERYSVIAERA